MRIRRHRIAFVADIEKMFRQIEVDPSQWDFQRIYWREGPDVRLKEYWITRVIYGMASSLHCAVRAMFQCARDHAKTFPAAAKAIESDTYVDDLSSGADSIDEAKLLAREIDLVLQKGGFRLRDWSSNAREITETMSGAGEQTVELHQEDGTKILGLIWLTNTDEFAIRVRADGLENAMTKRQILSCISKLYDPNGYIGPVVVQAKILMQDLWKLDQSSWDKRVPENVLDRWLEFCQGIKHLVNFRVPRWLGTNAISNIQLHGFCDASSLAFGACIYVRATDITGIHSSILLIAKSRVAPIKAMTIPRLELRAAELLARLMHRVKLVCEFDKAERFMWSDSTIVLHWLKKSTYDLKTFVANRVQAIQDHSKGIQWAHVNTKDNPADLISRGMSMADFLNSQKWKHGPEWLLQPTETWPKPKLAVTTGDKAEILKEYKRSVVNVNLIQIAMESGGKPLIDRFSSWKKILRITAYVLLFIKNARVKQANRRKKRTRAMAAPELTLDGLLDAATYWAKYTQGCVYKAEIVSLQTNAKEFPSQSKIAALRPKLVQGILRVGGRISKSLLEYEERCPIIIPPKSRLCYLIMDQTHRDNMHGGIQLMMQHIRQQFWIPQLRQQLRCFVSRCMRCVRESKRTTDQIMADLPAERVRPAQPFTRLGVDMAGPYKIRDYKGSESFEKGYIAVFVCQVTRAVHLEAVTSMSSRAFLDAFHRFCARRGTPVYIYSDNGTNFVGAERELQEAAKSWRDSNVRDLMNEKGITWRFITPAAPHQGGLWEAAVKQMKHHLRRVMGPVKYTYEGLSTLLSGIEACLNSRPLCALSDDPADCAALTPAHFLNGGPIKLPLPRRIDEHENELRGRKLYQTLQAQTDAFWECWSKDYLKSLMLRPKWRKERENVKVGQLVLIESDQFAPTYWSMGRIIETHPGLDGKVRNVTIKLQGGTVRRAVQRLCILPMDHDESKHLG